MINVIGLGYIGLPTALMLASSGNTVVGTDIDRKIVKKLNEQNVTFKEEGLEELLDSAIKNGIVFTDEFQKSDYYIVAVPTPYNSATKKINSEYLAEAVTSIVNICDDDATIIIESTVSPGTIDRVVRPVVADSHKHCNIVHAPERILPGKMISELVNNSRTIGADSKEVADRVKDIYSTFCKGEIVITDVRTAEMSKVVENTFRDINIAFANELAKICREDKMDVYEIIRIANKHPRVNILNPGPGVGGHCISVDPWFLVGDYPELSNLIYTAREVNDSMPAFVIDRIDEIMKNENISSYSEVGLYGLTYKPDVDDTREAPSLQLLNRLDDVAASEIKKYDPMIEEKILENQYLDFDEFIENVKLVVVMVDHSHIFGELDRLKDKVVFDTKNIIKNMAVYKL